MKLPVIILLGPTGVGKTGASILLAKELDTEIISADSMQIYRFMNIGTAKPSMQERTFVRHHMIDIIDPSESFSAGQYIEIVKPIIEGLLNAGKIPVIVGGTGLYIKAMTKGLFNGPSADLSLREELLSMEEQESGFLHTYLQRLDPEAASRIDKNDIRRMIRALEVCLKIEGKMSEIQKMDTKPLPYKFLKIGLTRERKELYSMINSRVDNMIEKGLFDEVSYVLSLNPDRTPMQAIGYKESALYIKGEISREEAIRLIKRNTRRYAKRQFTWFRREKDIEWIDVTGLHKNEEVFERLKTLLKSVLPGLSLQY